jgi:hypothetical protein
MNLPETLITRGTSDIAEEHGSDSIPGLVVEGVRRRAISSARSRADACGGRAAFGAAGLLAFLGINATVYAPLTASSTSLRDPYGRLRAQRRFVASSVPICSSVMDSARLKPYGSFKATVKENWRRANRTTDERDARVDRRKLNVLAARTAEAQQRTIRAVAAAVAALFAVWW